MLQRSGKRGKTQRRLPKSMGVPTSLDHRPIGFITIHGRRHAAATRSHSDVTALRLKFADHPLQVLHVSLSTFLANIAAVEKGMHTYALHTITDGFAEETVEMFFVRMDVAI